MSEDPRLNKRSKMNFEVGATRGTKNAAPQTGLGSPRGSLILSENSPVPFTKPIFDAKGISQQGPTRALAPLPYVGNTDPANSGLDKDKSLCAQNAPEL